MRKGRQNNLDNHIQIRWFDNPLTVLSLPKDIVLFFHTAGRELRSGLRLRVEDGRVLFEHAEGGSYCRRPLAS